MEKEIKEYYSFIPTAQDKTLDSIEKKYGKFKVASNEAIVERDYEFEGSSYIKVYKDAYKKGEKIRNGKVLMYGRNEDYQELRENDMHLNKNPIEEARANSPLISDLNFNHQIIGSDETGKGEIFKCMVVTASYVNGADDVKKYIEMGVDDSKEIPNKIQKLGEILTGIHNWEELLESLNENDLFVTDCSVTKIITNEEYNKRCSERKENPNDVLKEAHLEVLKEVYKKHPDSKIVVDNFFDKQKTSIQKFKEEMSSGDSSIDPNHVFVTVKADSKIMAVSLSSVISTYICKLSYDYVQGIVDAVKKNPEEKLSLFSGSPGRKQLLDFFSKLKPDLLEDFVNKYAKKSFKNVKAAISEMKQKGNL